MSRQVKKVNISGKEDKSNKVNSWSNTTTDTHYPSEKLVKDSLDGKANSTHTHSQYLTEHQDLSNYVTTDDSRLSDARTPTSHTHTKSQITDFPTIPSASSTVPSADTTNGSYGSGTSYARSNHTHPKSSLYAESSHTHSQYLTEHQSLANYVQKSSTSGLLKNDGSVDTTQYLSSLPSHNHDDRYYTESEVDTALNGKANSSHTHTKSQITDFPSIPSKTSELTNDSGFLTSHQDISGKIDSAGTGLSKSGTTLNHSNSITALTTASFKKVKYDSQGHITGTSDVSASDLPTHTHSQYLTSHQDITGKEDSSNKVSSWSSTTNNTKYPSEKLVKDSLDGKANSNHSHNLVDLNAQTSMGFKIFDYNENNQEISFADSLVFDGSDVTYNGYTIATLGDIPSVPSASTTTPSADTTNGAYGSGTSYARSNHTHPKSSLYAEASHTHTNVLSTSDDGDVYIYTNGTSQPPTSLGALLYNMDSEIDGKADTDHSHPTWKVVSTSSDSYATLYVNEAIRMCQLRYYRTGYNFTSTNELTLHTGLIPSAYRPPVACILNAYNVTIIGAIVTNGNLTVQTSSTGSKTINLSGMWHY